MSALEDISREITAIEHLMVRLNSEYDLDDGINDEAERAELDRLQDFLDELTMQHSALSQSGVDTSAMALGTGNAVVEDGDQGNVIQLDTTEIVASEMVSYFNEDSKRFFGTRMSNWASRSSQAILGARSELNVPVPDEGFSASNLVDVIKLIPVVGQYASVSKDVYDILEAGIQQINLSSGVSFADVGHDISRLFVRLQEQFTQSSGLRDDLYDKFVTCYRRSGDGDTVPKDLLDSEIESYAAGYPNRAAIARKFLMTCLETVEDPMIEFRPLLEPAGFAAGYVNLYFSVSHFSDDISLTGAYMDDTPSALVDAMKREYGRSTSVVDLPVKIRCEVTVPYMDHDDEDEDDSTFEFVRTEFLVLRNSEAPGNTSFTLSNVQTRDRGGEMAEKYSRMFLAGNYIQRVTLGALSGE